MSNVTQQSSISTPSIRPVLRDVIEQLFDEMLLTHGKKFVDQWAAAEPEKLVLHWEKELTGYTPREFKRGIEAQKTLDWPPTLAQFKKLCRPSIDPEAAYYEALEQGVAWEQGHENHWSSPAVFWAWRKVGVYEFKSVSYPALKARWERALTDELAKGHWEKVPAPSIQVGMSKTTEMSARGKQVLTSAIESISKSPNSAIDHRAWIRRVADKIKSGQPGVTPTMARMATEAANRQ